MNKVNWKRLALAALLTTLLLSATGCFVKPDPTVEDRDPDIGSVLPFPTATEIPTLPPSGGGEGFENWATNAPQNVTMQTPVPTIQVITPMPTPIQAFSPPPTSTPPPPVTITAPPSTKTAAPKATNTTGSLKHGAEGQNVRDLQKRLKELGYYSGSIDGSFGNATDEALRAFQRANGLSADGVAGSKTMTALNSRNAVSKGSSGKYATSRPTPKTYTPPPLQNYRYLQLGSSGTDVTNLQRRLKQLGYFNGTVNGRFGSDTKAAVEAFQKRNGCWVDGVAGEETQTVLFGNNALPYGGSVQSTTTTVANEIRTLKNGMNGEDVQLMQARLQDLYYYSGTINGKFDATTELAVKVFQQRNGLTSNGEAGLSTLEKLYAADAIVAPTTQPAPVVNISNETLALGSIGDDVLRLQERLYDLGYYTGLFDGVYSESVKAAVTNFQKGSGLTADGKAGKSTQVKLYDAKAKAVAGVDETFATLREGDSGERVRALQTLLTTYGYFSNDVDGQYGNQTVTAVAQFQSQNGLLVDGVAGPSTLQVLYQGNPIYASQDYDEQEPTVIYSTLRQGMSGPDVMMMQEYLKEFGYYMGEPQGRFDQETLIAVQAFQAENQLKTDGIAGQATLELLYSMDAYAADGDSGILQIATIDSAGPRNVMRQGDEGQDVYNLQERLQVLGYFLEDATGKYDAATREAVRAFQQRNQLKVDGEAGLATVNAMYAINVVQASGQYIGESVELITNRVRELEEQRAGGAIQASLSGGGVAASYNANIYFTGGKNGSLYMRSGNGAEKQIYESPARFIHATQKGVVFVSGSKILRIPVDGGKAETLASVGGISKLSMIGDRMYYQEGGSLVQNAIKGEVVVLADNINDFTIDVYQYAAYIATDRGIRNIALNGNGDTLLVSSRADQVQICDSVLFFRSGGELYRLENGISVLLMDVDATWMGVYRDMIYYISGDRLYRCDTMGQNSEVFYDGQTADVSFVSGKAYITTSVGGPVVNILSVE